MGKKHYNILLVEDEALIALNQKMQLEKHGYTIIHVLSGEKAVELVKISEHKINLILMDIDLGKGIDGTQAAKKILEFEEIPVVFLSSHTEPEVVEKTEVITSYGYVVKNSGITVLDASIKMAFKLFAAHKDILKHKSDAENANIALESTVNNLKIVNESLTRLDRAIENTNEIIFITNIDGLITYINPQFIKTYGYSEVETLGKICPRDLGLASISDEEDANFWKILQNKHHIDTRYINKTRDGKVITVETSIDPIFDNDGNLKEFVQIQRDISEQILAEEKILKSNDYLSFLNTIANEQANTNNLNDLVELIIKQLEKITNAIFVIFSEYDSTNRLLKNMKMSATRPVLNTLIQMSGKKILNTEIPVDDEYYQEMINERINTIPNLHKNTHGAVDPIASSLIQKTLKIDKIWGLTYVIDNKLYGTSVFALKKGQRKPDREVLDSFINVSAISIRRLHLESQIRESEERFRGIFEQSTIGIYRTTPEGEILLANPTLIKMLGYKNFEEIKKRNLNNTGFEPGYDRIDFKEILEKENRITGLESVWIKKDGTKLHIRESAVAIRDEDGKICYYQGMAEDISDKRQIENIKEIHNQLSKSANTMQSLLNNYEEAIWSVDREFKFTFVNSYFIREFKEAFDIDLKLGIHAFSKVRPELQKIWKPKYEAALEGNRTSFEFEENALRGKKYFRVNLNPIHTNGKITGVSAISVDITKEKLTELEVQKEMQRSQKYLDIAGVMFVAIDRNGNITLVNNKLCETTGYTQGELLGKNWFELMLPERIKAEIIPISKKLLNGDLELVEYYENPILTKDREERLVAWHNTILKDNKGNITGHLSSGNDITSQRQIENKIKESEILFRTVADYTNDWEYWCGQDGNYKYISPAVEKITGYSSEDFRCTPDLYEHIIYPDDLGIFQEHMLSIESVIEHEPIDFRITTKNNGVIWINHICRTIFDDKGKNIGVRGSNRDITKRKLAENEIIRLLADKDLILKEVHHRIKNNMTTLLSLITLQGNRVKGKEAANALMETENRIRSMMVLYDTLYKSADFESASIKLYLSPLIDNIIDNFPNSKMISVKKKISDFQVDAKSIFNIGIIVNELITNTMKYAFIHRSKGKISISADSFQGSLILIIEDNGVGMPADFSLKANPGFGMLLVDLLVTQMNGNLKIESTEGTKFTIKCDL